MKARRGMAVALVLLTWAGATYAQSVSWVPGTTAPKDWSIDPAKPSPADIISFTGPTPIYSNTCVGEYTLGGTPQIAIDAKARVVLLWFKGPVSPVCTTDYNPVTGLKGDFGPLEAGDWTFTCLSREVGFTIHFTVQEKFAYHVDADAPGPVYDGRTWATAMPTLQEALAAVASGDQIVVAEGTYKPDPGGMTFASNRGASFLLKEGVTIRGGFAGYGQPSPDERDPVKHMTILSGDLLGNDRGNQNLSDNSLHVVVGPPDGAAATLDGFTIAGGNADGAYPHHYGGGLYNPDGKVQVVNCTFQGNTGVCGAAVMNFGPSATLVNCQLVGNHALMQGGALYNYEGTTTLVNCRVVGNTADYADATGGAAIYNLNGALNVLDSTIADNRAAAGRAIASFIWTPFSAVKVRVVNSILYNGGDEVASNSRGLVSVTYSDVQGGWSDVGNIGTDPQFVQPGVRNPDGSWTDGDYRLKTTSPALDAGDSSALPVDSLDLDADGDVAEVLPLDLDNSVRIKDTKVDMGAYEQAKKSSTPAVTSNLVIPVGDGFLVLAPDPTAPSGSNTYIGSVDVDVELNFRAQLTATIQATSAAGGKWSAWLVPDTVGPGKDTFVLWVKGENLDLGALPGGSKDVEVAQVEFYVARILGSS
jgi:hypothetical protein